VYELTWVSLYTHVLVLPGGTGDVSWLLDFGITPIGADSNVPGGGSGGFKLEGFVGHWPRGPPLLCWFHRPTSETRGRLRGRGSNVRNAAKCVL